MNVLLIMLPGAVLLAAVALAGFIWSLKSGQFDDPAGDAARVLLDDERPAK
jgi:cbb3-type cytochrome oxidase maturation protein